MKFCLKIFIAFVLFSYDASGKCLGIKSGRTFKYLDTTISLGNGFIIYASKGEYYPDPQYSFTTYTSIKIIKDKKIIFIDTNLTEYEFDHNLQPFYRKLEGDEYEFLIGVNDRPDADYFLHLIVNNSVIVKQNKIPASITELKIIRSDGLAEGAGFKDYNESFGDSTVAYDPMLIYVYMKDGILLDSAKTIIINTEIYGKFEGYKYLEAPHKMKIFGAKLNNRIREIEKE